MRLKALSPAYEHLTTDTAQRFLAGARDAVNGVLESLDVVRELRKEQTGDVRGRLTHNEEDLLRAAVVLAGAGLDVNIKEKTSELVVELLGVDVYDPTTGEVRSSSTDDIACWFIDTNYNQESFFVRHAYFTGGDKPYERLQRTLRAGIDEEAWSSLYSTVSRPFAKPETGRIAVKVINHYGDEVLKVYEVG